MEMFLSAVAVFICKVAEMGAGFLSIGAGYQPEVPEELMKQCRISEYQFLHEKECCRLF